MRNVTLFFILIAGLNTLAQNKFDYLSCQEVLTEKVNAIQLKIWNGVMDGKLIPYSSDSLIRILSLEEIKDKTQGMDTSDYQEHVFLCRTNSHHKNDGQIEKISELPVSISEWDSWGNEDFDVSDSLTELDSGWYEYYSPEERFADSVIRIREETKSNRVDSFYNIRYACEARVDFVASRDVLGISFGYERSADINSWSTEFKCTNISLVTELAMESGFILGNRSLFHIRLDHLEVVLTEEEIDLVRALSFQAKNLGNYLPKDVIWQERFDMQEVYELQSRVRFDNNFRFSFIGKREIALLAKYNSDVFFETANFLLEEDNPLDYKSYLYKDSLFKTPWKGLMGELYSEHFIELPSEGDPYTILTHGFRGIGYPIFTIDRSKLEVSRIGENDYTISVANEVHRVNSFPKNEYDKWVKAYFSFSSIKHLLQPHDRVILEALLEELVEKN